LHSWHRHVAEPVNIRFTKYYCREETPVPGSLDKKREEDATFCLRKGSIFSLFLSNEPGKVPAIAFNNSIKYFTLATGTVLVLLL
jgi:hypothetical protein